jgi:hypothetical protein
MTPQEKAREIVIKMQFQNPPLNFEQAKQCALIAVDEILDDDMYGMEEEHFENRIDYWEQVKQEIEKL